MNDAPRQEVALRKLALGMEIALSPELVDLHVSCEQDLTGMVRCRIHAYVWGESEPVRRQEVQYPADWREAVKERWAPRWFLKRHPVRYSVVVLEAVALYPKFRPAIAGQDCVIHVGVKERWTRALKEADDAA